MGSCPASPGLCGQGAFSRADLRPHYKPLRHRCLTALLSVRAGCDRTAACKPLLELYADICYSIAWRRVHFMNLLGEGSRSLEEHFSRCSTTTSTRRSQVELYERHAPLLHSRIM